jgi:hypothetical protein
LVVGGWWLVAGGRTRTANQLVASVFYQFPASNIKKRQDFDYSPRVIIATIRR